MRKKQIKRIVAGGIGCGIFLAAAVIYSILFNGSRLVEPMDFSQYVFSAKDPPMLAAGACIAVWAVYTAAVCLKSAFTKNKPDTNYTRTLSPFWGLFGFAGFAGFLGFWTYAQEGVVFPFIFFLFFGFFGLFFEGKLSHTLQDELFLANRRKAESKAYKTGFSLLFVVLWLAGIGLFSNHAEWCAIFMLISVSLIYALVLFLSSYLLYRYEKEE